MNISDSDNSDNEGFVAPEIKIDEKLITHQQKDSAQYKDFEPYYIVGEGLLRKQPPEALLSCQNIPNMPKSLPCTNLLPTKNEHLPTANELFLNTKLYSLVYKRFREPLGTEIKATFSHQIRLSCCQDNNLQSYRSLKEWDHNCLRQMPTFENSLTFDSRFQGGNLLSAFKEKKQQNTYVLFMQNDTNTYGYNQWFHFSVRNMKKCVRYTFKIVNFKKSYSFFKNGLQPMVFSLNRAQKQGNGWFREGNNISYYPSQYSERECRPYYTLQFSMYFDHEDDYVTISPYAPYSYSKLISKLKGLEKVAGDNNISWKLKSIAKSISNNQVPYLVLSNKKVKKTVKKKILILARQHSGQTWSSFLVQSLMEELVNQKTQWSQWYLEHYDFHIFPMLNVDGVIYGNFRCDLAGYDLNRTWKNPLQLVHPQIFHIKRQIAKLSQKYDVQMCLDLHTHSKQYGAFAYCCVDSQQCRDVPELISTFSPFFRYKACTFGISGDKKYTARAAVYGLTSSIHTITVELSAYGFKLYPRKYPVPYTPKHVHNIAKGILKGYYAYATKSQPEIEQEIIQIQEGQNVETLDIAAFQKNEQKLEKEEIPVQGSDSQPEVDEIELQIKIKTIFPAVFAQEIKSTQDKKSPEKRVRKVKKKHSLNKSNIESKFESKKNQVVNFTKEEVKLNNSMNSVSEGKDMQTSKEQITKLPVKAKKSTYVAPNTTQYKKHSTFTAEKTNKVTIERPTKPMNLVQFSLKKLPISVPEKSATTSTNNPNTSNVLLQEPAPLFATHSYGRREERFDKTFSTYEAMCRPRVRIQSKKIAVAKEDNRLQQELPYLCVMSEHKKQVQLERIRDRQLSYNIKRQDSKRVHYTGASGLNVNQRLHENFKQKLQDKQRNLGITKIGNNSFTRYNEGVFALKP